MSAPFVQAKPARGAPAVVATAAEWVFWQVRQRQRPAGPGLAARQATAPQKQIPSTTLTPRP
jgi:hypothetical protein